MVDDVDSFVTIARLLKERGAYKIYVMATHGLLSAEAPRLIEDSPIDEVKGKMILVKNFTALQRYWQLQWRIQGDRPS